MIGSADPIFPSHSACPTPLVAVCSGKCLHTQAQTDMLEDQLQDKSSLAAQLSSSLEQSCAEREALSLSLVTVKSQLAEAMQTSEQQAAQLVAQRAGSACELDSARQQTGQLTRQLSEQTQKLQSLQVCLYNLGSGTHFTAANACYWSPWYTLSKRRRNVHCLCLRSCTILLL